MLNLRILGTRIINKEVRDNGLIEKRIELMLTQKKTLRFIEIDK